MVEGRQRLRFLAALGMTYVFQLLSLFRVFVSAFVSAFVPLSQLRALPCPTHSAQPYRATCSTIR
jgi:Na+-transporting methylmalonyl-CoA/oxaloacetate decarboxylase gamma subunit